MNGMKKPKMPKMTPDMGGMDMPKFGSRAMRPGGMKKGGNVHADAAMDKKLIRKEIARAEKMEEKSEGMKKGGKVKMAMGGALPQGMNKPSGMMPSRGAGGPTSQTINPVRPRGMARGGGVETKGKTKGKFI
jgi:hypothetical protein